MSPGTYRTCFVLLALTCIGLLSQSTVFADGPIDFDGVQEIGDLIAVQYQSTAFNRRTGQLKTNIVVTNASSEDISCPLILVITSFSTEGISLASPDNQTPDGHPYIDLSAQVGEDGVLASGESTTPLKIAFNNPNRRRFRYDSICLAPRPGNRSPRAGDDAIVTNEDQLVSVSVNELLANDRDEDDDDLDIKDVSQGDFGSTMLIGDTVIYTPSEHRNGLDSFTYIVRDGNGGTGTGKVLVSVMPIDDPPHVRTSSLGIAIEQEQYEGTIVAVDPDNPDEQITFSLEKAPGGMTLHPQTGFIAWVPTHDQIGEHEVSIMVMDRDGHASTRSFVLLTQIKIENIEALSIGKASLDPLADPAQYDTRLTYDGSHIKAQHLVVTDDFRALGFENLDLRRFGLNIDSENLVDIKSPFFANPTGSQLEFDVPRGKAHWVFSYYEERGPLEPEFGKPTRNSRPVAAYAWGSIENISLDEDVVSFDLVLDPGLVDGTKSFNFPFLLDRVRLSFNTRVRSGKITQ